jgi:uroporphyrinogen decarboxylase
VQGNLDPIALFAPQDLLRDRVNSILSQAAGRPGHIFNVGHGIVPGTPVENVQAAVRFVREYAPTQQDLLR